MSKILIIRFSAFGDVAISVPVIRNFTKKYPEKEIIYLTKKQFVPLFSEIENIEFYTPDLKNYKGFFGLYKLFKEIKNSYEIDCVLDIHNVLRTKILRFFFNLSQKKTYKINKARREKRKLTRKRNKELNQLKHSGERYYEVFQKAGYEFQFDEKYEIKERKIDEKVKESIDLKEKNIGIAPFALHKQKTYPFEKMEEVIKLLQAENIRIIIFGGGEKEKELAAELEKNYTNVFSIIGKYNLETELDIISKLDLMLTMDSSNMHLAAILGTKILSIWGATHPFLGFYPFSQNNEINFIQIPVNELNCRPCSVFGNKKCYRNDLACLNKISSQKVYQKILENL